MVLNLPGLEVFPGDLLVSAGAADYLCHPLLLLNSGPVCSTFIICLLWDECYNKQRIFTEYLMTTRTWALTS